VAAMYYEIESGVLFASWMLLVAEFGFTEIEN
jgi:hypothetical protein